MGGTVPVPEERGQQEGGRREELTLLDSFQITNRSLIDSFLHHVTSAPFLPRRFLCPTSHWFGWRNGLIGDPSRATISYSKEI
jgi:hypothetical protein